MSKTTEKSNFEAELLRPAKLAEGESWAFLVLPKEVSETLPRRGRATVEGTINDHDFQATLEPDGQLSHWLKVDEKLQKDAGIEVGDTVSLEIAPVEAEPEPEVPSDLQEALDDLAEAMKMWNDTTTIARLDWIHWIESAKQSKTCKSRVASACDMLTSGKKRVCCFDQSGFYSKSLSPPEVADSAD